MITEHELKCWPEYFQSTVDGDKLFEVRLNDRNFKLDQGILLREWNPRSQVYTGRLYLFRISYVYSNPELLKENIVILGIGKAPIR